MLFIYLKEKNLASRFRCCRPPGGLWTGIKSFFLFKKLEVSLLDNIGIFSDVIYVFKEKMTIDLYINVLQASRWTLDR